MRKILDALPIIRAIFQEEAGYYRYISGGLLAILAINLRHFLVRRSRFVTDYSTVARRVNDLSYDEFDVVIVGGGTAGCVLASRLTEDPSLRVLVIEAGGSGKQVLESRLPSAWGPALRTQYGYQLYTTPQVHANGKKKYMPRGKLLGGCKLFNIRAQYGSPSDFDEWAQVTGDQSWSWSSFNRYFRKFEKFTPDPRLSQTDASQRGTQGPVEVGYFTNMWKGCEFFIKSGINIGIPLSPDFNLAEGSIGINRVMTYVSKRRQRVSTETAYLTDAVLSRNNLKVVVHARATRILFEKVDGRIRAVGVNFTSSQGGQSFQARARKEIILSSGALHSPHLLMISGVGPADHLKGHGIQLVHDLPGVGSHLVDHPVVNIRCKERTGLTSNFLSAVGFLNTIKFVKAMVQYQLFGTGPIASNLGEAAAFFRSDDPIVFPSKDFPEKILDSTSGPESPDLEIIHAPLALEDHTNVFEPSIHAFSMYVALLRPTSVGTVRLKSASPWEDPLIDPNYCQTQHDVDVLVRGLRAALKIAQTEPLSSIVDADSKHPGLDHHLPFLSDEELVQVVRDRVETLYHPSSTCRMAPLKENGVVDSQQRVYGIQNLRICDASTFSTPVSGHPAGACIAAAEKLSDIIKLQLAS
ncbi:hypothetical protein SERLA73DRAFT_54648 [Serpula lacrymans var. lacrymans S7.3]|uniref:Glucose-methanol-choline oxidoreductase N-terminal domain-containing protein n=1 Tax=Serpula lacrymans var. lacrymans (strain S7.3) TaxID=936435 RepID=F8PY04_SERL3|nr:hypothetical protein SERLA73DRAFT_54648 [Serpula lacrymans var. lacrymans S7.3]